MNTPNITLVRIFSKSLPFLLALAPLVVKAEAIQSEFSPREPTAVKTLAVGTPDVIAVPRAGTKRNVVGGNSEVSAPMQELVILNTDKGFVPATVRLRKGTKYVVHVVNVNEKEKNVSFVLDGFAQHQSTYYGKVTEFTIDPKTEGVYSFQCPETALEGRMVVFAPPEFNKSPAAAPIKPEPVSIRVPSSVPGGSVDASDDSLFGSGK